MAIPRLLRVLSLMVLTSTILDFTDTTNYQKLGLKSIGFLSRVSILTRDIDIANLSVHLSVRPSVRP